MKVLANVGKITFALGAVALLVAPASAGVGLETFVMATVGQTNDNTTGQPSVVVDNFGGWGTAVPAFARYNPALLDVAGTYRRKSAALGTILTDSTSVTGGGLPQRLAPTPTMAARVQRYGRGS